MDKEMVKEVLLSQDSCRAEKGTIRRSLMNKVQELKGTPFIIIISGIRRCGKSTLLKELKDDDSYYVNFDDERFIDLDIKDLSTIYEILVELFGVRRTFLLDEIQNIPGWERFVRRLQDEGKKVFVTGSNATMLSRELGTHLSGRNIALSLYPFSFREYLEFRGISYSLERPTTDQRNLLKKAFNEYMREGGFPEYLRTKREEYLQSLYQNILYRDVITRYGLTSEVHLKETAFYAASNIAKEVSFNNIRRLTGLTSATTIKEYFGYLENSYLTFLVPRYDHSLKKQIYHSKKVYLIDTALARLVGFRPVEEKGRLLENLVYLSLKRSGNEIFFHKAKRECDFIVRRDGRITQAIQVTWDLDSSRRREEEGLKEAMDLYGPEDNLVLTYDHEGSIQIDGKDVRTLPVWKWLLENEVAIN